ncbi:iminophenyl-pyruvate dimer synthase VioB [Paludibacterium purpuratum]|uniref:Iminophenyl-pyruvate dimer synthase VioB n=1 Tax=Paludibacterium purpuratum TaxID=1144873 RepID=A0A4R7BCC7_9NEIS|nr:iminophenyl-pyruvate dimer synthase VioB [Paludibacterium purpuratum]TDR81376.1 iminophenyl-pyruvate dimer synthase VioB [Paludibacterium purpuratum]
MSVLDFPRLYFRGHARANIPTANRNEHGQIDMASNTVRMAGAPFDLALPPTVFHQYLQQLGPRFDAEGHPDADGIFSQAVGFNACGNNHFSWEAVTVSAVQTDVGAPVTDDDLVGARLSLWGHYNDYLRTTFNRARWVDSDPTRPDAVQIYAGQFVIGERETAAHAPSLFSADLAQAHSARWVHGSHILELPQHFLREDFARARLFQFSLAKADAHFLFSPEAERFTALTHLRQAMADESVLGLTVQYALFNMAPPPGPNSPAFFELVGVLGLWRRNELATYPTGRLLLPRDTALGPMTVRIGAEHVSFNMPTSIPFSARSASCEGRPTPMLAAKLPLGELVLRDQLGCAIARVPQAVYLDYWRHHGVLDVACLAEPVGALSLQGDWVRWDEQEWVSQSDSDNLYLEAPDRRRGRVFPQALTVQSYWRGEHRPYPALALRVEGEGQAQASALVRDNALEVTLAGQRPGCARLYLGDGEAFVHLRVLPDDWHLADTPVEAVDYAFLYRHVMSYYELIYPFMADKVFSLADRCKCETYARLMWQMCDPQNRDKSYYMPSTRELSEPKAMLFLKYLAHVEAAAAPVVTAAEPPVIGDRAQLVAALKTAVDLELSIMLQYAFAGYSIPSYAQGQARVACGQWQPAQLALACGSGDRRRDGGMRGTLLEIAHEEMIHYLVVNNLLMALGEPFYPGRALVGEEARQVFGLDTEFAFEPFSEHVLARFVRWEWPNFIPAPGPSIAGFYAAIRQALATLPALFVGVDGKCGGEHHLFLNELTNRAYPAYQLDVFDRDSALFAIDFVTAQGEGAALDSAHFAQSHFQRLRQLNSQLLQQPVPFEPALPVLKNPVLRERAGCTVVLDEQARTLMALYQGGYDLMLQMMALHFAQRPLGSLRRSRLMNAAIDLMTGWLRPLSLALMQLPSGEPGRYAGPPVPEPIGAGVADDYVEGCRMLAERCRALSAQAVAMAPGGLGAAPRELLDFYTRQLMDLADGKVTREA